MSGQTWRPPHSTRMVQWNSQHLWILTIGKHTFRWNHIWSSSSEILEQWSWELDNNMVCILTQRNYLYWVFNRKLLMNTSPIVSRQKRKTYFSAIQWLLVPFQFKTFHTLISATQNLCSPWDSWKAAFLFLSLSLCGCWSKTNQTMQKYCTL